MIIKLYTLIWLLGLMVAGIFYLTGNLTPLVQVVFGFSDDYDGFYGCPFCATDCVIRSHERKTLINGTQKTSRG